MPTGIPRDETQIILTALNLCGFPLYQSIDAAGPAGAVMDNLYDVVRQADLSTPNWRFATKVVTLSQVAGVNPGFIYYNAAFQIPPDCLAIWQIWPGIPYEVYGERIWTYSTTQQLQMQYRADIPPTFWPAAYVMYFCYLLALTAAPNITKNTNLLASLDAEMKKWRAQAMVVNTQGRPNQGITNSPWINSRPAGSFYGTSWST